MGSLMPETGGEVPDALAKARANALAALGQSSDDDGGGGSGAGSLMPVRRRES